VLKTQDLFVDTHAISYMEDNLAISRSSVFSQAAIRNLRRYVYWSLKSDSSPHFCNDTFI